MRRVIACCGKDEKHAESSQSHTGPLPGDRHDGIVHGSGIAVDLAVNKHDAFVVYKK